MTSGAEQRTAHDRRRSFSRRAAAVTLAALGILLATEAAAAQAPESRGRYTGYLGAGVSGIATRELNDRLAAIGFPAFGGRPRAVALGAYRLLESGVMLGGEWHFLPIGDEEHAGRDVGLGGGYATLGIGYALEVGPKLRVYPRLGLGVAGMGLWIDEAAPVADGAPDFEGALTDPTPDSRFSTLSQASMAIDLGAGGELPLGGRGALVGLRVGYVATPFDQGWSRDGRVLAGAPRATVAGPYVRLLMGWTR